MSSSKFAEAQLKKWGWNEGEGIGKTNQGIVDPIKASFKFDNSGVGFDIADEFTTNWWEHLFNHTAKKIDPSNELKTVKEEPEKEKSGFLNRKSLFYARFQKASVLVDGQNVKCEEEKKQKPENQEDSYDKKGKKIVSDDELFKLCKGRTAHKGARHGIKMNGKLARLEEQESNFRQELERKSNKNKEEKLKSETNEVKRKSEEISNETNQTEESSDCIKTKKKKSKKNKE